MSKGRGGKTPIKVVELINNEVLRLGQNGAARAIGIALYSTQKYMKGIGEPSYETLQKLANYFNVTFTIEIKPEEIKERREGKV